MWKTEEVEIKDPHPAFITVYKSISGWKTVLMSWSYEDDMYLPWVTGYFGFKNREDAVSEGRIWAADEEIEFKG